LPSLAVGVAVGDDGGDGGGGGARILGRFRGCAIAFLFGRDDAGAQHRHRLIGRHCAAVEEALALRLRARLHQQLALRVGFTPSATTLTPNSPARLRIARTIATPPGSAIGCGDHAARDLQAADTIRAQIVK